MTATEFAHAQQEDRRSSLSHLLDACERRYLEAADLVGVTGSIVDRIREGRRRGVYIDPLFPAWQVICDRYTDRYFSPQESLFKDHRSEVLERWSRYLHWELFPMLVRENEFVRNVLRAVEQIPSKAPKDAAAAVKLHVLEITLPGETTSASLD